MTICLVSGPSPLTFQNIKNHEKGDAERGGGGAKNETLCAGFGVVRVFLFNVARDVEQKTRFNSKVGFQVSGFMV